MVDEQMNAGLAEREQRKAERVKRVRETAGLPPVRVLPANDLMRKHLRHPSNKIGFRAEGSAEWPNDSFTQMRLRDGDITLEEKPAGQEAGTQPQPQPEASQGHAETHSSQGSAQGGEPTT
jgi:hypothetical protein